MPPPQASAAHVPPGLTNVAYGKKAKQSSTDYWESNTVNSAAAKAIDGNPSSQRWVSSCARTKHQATPWWVVDLGFPHAIESITLWNMLNSWVRLNRD